MLPGEFGVIYEHSISIGPSCELASSFKGFPFFLARDSVSGQIGWETGHCGILWALRGVTGVIGRSYAYSVLWAFSSH